MATKPPNTRRGPACSCPLFGVDRKWLAERRNGAFDPNVWSGRALQEVFVDLVVSGLASMYPVSSWSCFTWQRDQAMRVCGSGDVRRRRLPCRSGKAVYWRAALPLGHATTFAAARWRRAHRGPRRGTSSCRYQCRSRRLRYRVSETSRAPCLWRPLPASLADGAGARPDHPINGHCRCGLSLRSPTIFCYDPCRTDVNSLPLGRCLFVFENKRPARSCRADHLTRKPVEKI